MSSVEFEGLEEMLDRIDEYGMRGVQAATQGVEQFAQHVLTESQKIVPFDEGTLQQSIIDEPIKNGEKVIGYDTPYAAKQHEDTALMHPGPNSKNPVRGAKGQAKYLENPLKENAHLMKDFVGNQLDKVK